jgi:sigma-B regulation protein RsbU (phosphoserine phosphatase)
VLGMLEDAAFEQETLELGAGDRVLLYTDGVTEAEDAAGEMFGEERLDALVHALPATLGAREISDRVLAGVREFLDGVEAGDDITLMILRVTRDRNAGSAAGRTAQTPR